MTDVIRTATVVTVEPTEPYPTGTPAVTDMNNVHPPQLLTPAEDWEAQSEANLAAGGMIAGGDAYVGTLKN